MRMQIVYGIFRKYFTKKKLYKFKKGTNLHAMFFVKQQKFRGI